VDVNVFNVRTEKEDYVTVSRLVPIKGGLIAEAFTAMPDQRLIVIGDGPDMRK
jgi:hypothetical protein